MRVTGLELRKENKRVQQLDFAKENWMELQWGFVWEKLKESDLEYQWAAGSVSGKERLKVAARGWRTETETVER